jgi:hypothetical protein
MDETTTGKSPGGPAMQSTPEVKSYPIRSRVRETNVKSAEKMITDSNSEKKTYCSRRGGKDTSLILTPSQEDMMDSQPARGRQVTNPEVAKLITSPRRSNSLDNPRQTLKYDGEGERALKRSRTTPTCMACSKTQDFKSITITCTLCSGVVCQKCSQVEEYIITASENGCLPGFTWLCPACQNGLPSFMTMTKTLTEMKDNSENRMSSLENKIDSIESNLSTKLEEKLPVLASKIEKTIESNLGNKMSNFEKKLTEAMNTKMGKI